MNDPQPPENLVLSYVVIQSGIATGTDVELKKALAAGYMVLDVISTPCGSPSDPASSTGFSFVCVTVVLARPTNERNPYRGGGG
jgi:hypothetical protein